MEVAKFLARNEKNDGMEIKTGRDKLIIASSIFVWVANPSNH